VANEIAAYSAAAPSVRCTVRRMTRLAPNSYKSWHLSSWRSHPRTGKAASAYAVWNRRSPGNSNKPNKAFRNPVMETGMCPADSFQTGSSMAFGHRGRGPPGLSEDWFAALAAATRSDDSIPGSGLSALMALIYTDLRTDSHGFIFGMMKKFRKICGLVG
jgi:hypothetical protein